MVDRAVTFLVDLADEDAGKRNECMISTWPGHMAITTGGRTSGVGGGDKAEKRRDATHIMSPLTR